MYHLNKAMRRWLITLSRSSSIASCSNSSLSNHSAGQVGKNLFFFLFFNLAIINITDISIRTLILLLTSQTFKFSWPPPPPKRFKFSARFRKRLGRRRKSADEEAYLWACELLCVSSIARLFGVLSFGHEFVNDWFMLCYFFNGLFHKLRSPEAAAALGIFFPVKPRMHGGPNWRRMIQ